MQKWAAGKIAVRQNNKEFQYQGVFLRSCTGSGKTLGYLVPILMALQDEAVVQVVIMANMAEMANKIHQIICYLLGNATTSCMVAGGLYSKQTDLDVIRNLAPRIVVGTGGRLMDIAQDMERPFRHASILVLDEGQLMLLRAKQRSKFRQSWYDQSKCIWDNMCKSPYKQLVSATATSQANSVDVMADLIRCPRSEIARMDETKESLKIQLLSRTQYRVIFQTEAEKLEGLAALFMEPNSDLGRFLEPVASYQTRNGLSTKREAEQLREKCVIFCNKREELQTVQRYLNHHTPFITDPARCKEVDEYGCYCFPHHKDLDYTTIRQTVYGDFEQGKTCAVITAGSLALSMDVRNIGAIINFAIPKDIDRMVHQCGRTGRGYATDEDEADATPIINLVVKGEENDRLERFAKQLGIQLHDADPLRLPARQPLHSKSKSTRSRSRSRSPAASKSTKNQPHQKRHQHRRQSRSRSRSRSRTPPPPKSHKSRRS